MKNVGLPHVKWEADIEKARLQWKDSQQLQLHIDIFSLETILQNNIELHHILSIL